MIFFLPVSPTGHTVTGRNPTKTHPTPLRVRPPRDYSEGDGCTCSEHLSQKHQLHALAIVATLLRAFFTHIEPSRYWYAKAGEGLGDRASRGEGNNSAWLVANRRAITALQPNYGCFYIQDDGTFTLDIPPPHPRMLDSSGRSLCGPPYFSPLMAGAPAIEIVPGGSISAAALRSGAWQRQHAVRAAVDAAIAHHWAGIELDDEFCCDGDGLTAVEIESWISFVGNLSAALSAVGKRLHVDVNSYPWMDLSGPHHVAALAGVGRKEMIAMPPLLTDMSTYWAPGAAGPHSHVCNVSGLARLGVPLPQISLGIGLVEDFGHENASCSSCRGHASSVSCPQIKSGTCGNCVGCFNYGWTEPSLRAFVTAAVAAGVESLSIYRQDLTPANGTRTKIPPWFVEILADFLAGRNASVAHD